jgi:phosphoribosylamine--glycine ligase
VLEFNVRGGDPETEVLLPRLETDALELFVATASGKLADAPEIKWSRDHACGVVLADGDYPASVTPGRRLLGTDAAAARPGVRVYHMGTRRREGHLETAGGRVLCIVGLGADLVAARARAYAAVQDVSFSGMRYRTDIGWRELSQQATSELAGA